MFIRAYTHKQISHYPSRNILLFFFFRSFSLSHRFALYLALILRMYNDHDHHLTFIYTSPIEREREREKVRESARLLRAYTYALACYSSIS
jgi:hypothetical protein